MSYSCASSLSARDTQACAPPQARWTPWEQDGSLRGHAPHVHPSCSLTLEWNSLGTWEEAFAAFCGALAANGALRQLDLRNNQISHKGAEELALALKSNTSLQQLGEAASTGLFVLRPGQEVLVWGGRGRGCISSLPQPSHCFLCPLPEGWGWERRGTLSWAPDLWPIAGSTSIPGWASPPTPAPCFPSGNTRFPSRPALESHRPPGGPRPGKLSPQQQNPVEAGAGWEQHPR